MSHFLLNPHRFGVPFSPSDVAGIVAWYKGDGVLYQDSGRTTLATADGDPIGSWSDLSGSDRHAAQATSTKRPLLKTGANGINSLPVARFDGVDDFLQAAFGLTMTQPSTLFAVVKLTSATGGTGRYIFDGASVESNLLQSQGGTTNWTVYGGSGNVGTVASDTNPHVIRAVWNGANSNIGIDGAAGDTGNAGAATTTGITMGIGGNGTTGPAPVSVGEVIRYSGNITGTDRTNIETYLKNKWGTP